MIPYTNKSGKSGIISYEIGDDFINVKFSDGKIYTYNNAITGEENIKTMKELAENGNELNSFISKIIRKNYASKSA